MRKCLRTIQIRVVSSQLYCTSYGANRGSAARFQGKRVNRENVDSGEERGNEIEMGSVMPRVVDLDLTAACKVEQYEALPVAYD